MGNAMARRREGWFDIIVKLPWPLGILAGILGYVVFRYGIGWFFASSKSPILRGMDSPSTSGIYASLGLFVMIACWAAAGVSFLLSRKRKRLLEAQTGLDSLKAMSWREFETLVGEAFRRRGYAVEETGGGGKDGGIDLILRKGGRTELVQCKQWKTRQVKVPVVREMWGLLVHHKADAVKIVCVGTFTADAEQFAEGKAIELITGERLLELVRAVQTASPHSTTPAPAIAPIPRSAPNPVPLSAADPACPRCGATMFKRFNRQNNQMFWGCIMYPRCKGTQSI